MKKILSLVLVLALVLTSFSFAAADPVTVGQDLKALGVLTGDENGNLNPDQQLTREQAIVVLVRMMGKEADAKATTTASSFKDIKGTFYGPYIAYAELQGWTTGKSAGVFGFGQTATIDEIYAFMLRALGYTVATLPEAVTKAAELKLNTDVTAEAGKPVLRGQVFITMNNTLNTAPKDGKTALVYVLKLKPEPVVPVVDVTTTSVKAINLKEMEVVFSGEVDKTTAETAANYVITTTGTAATPVPVLQADGKTVKITLGTKATQQEVVKVTVKNVKDKAAKVIASKDFADVTFFDATVPTADAIKLTGPTTLEVTFSEVMDSTVNPTILVNNGVYGASFDAWDGNTAKFNLSTKLADGNYTVKITGAKDAAGYTALAKEFTLAYAKDTTVPTATVDKADQLKVTVKFSKKVKNVTVDKFYHTFSAWTATNIYQADGTTAVTAGDFVDTVVVQFATSATVGKPLVAGNNTLTIAQGAAGSELQDLWGNKFATATYTVAVTADTTAPKVSKVEVTSEKVIKVTFDEDVLGATTAANYIVYDKDGKEVTTAKTVAYASKVATITFASNLASGNYTVKVSNVTDTSIYLNKIVAQTEAFAITDLTAATSITGEYVVSGSNYLIYVTYNEDMDTTTTLNKANYQLGTGALASAATIEAFGGNKVVKITTTVNPAGLTVKVKNVKDAAGNALDLFTTLETGALATAGAPTGTGIKTTSLNTIEVKFNKHLSAAPAASFTVDTTDAGAAVAVAAATYVNNSDGSSTVTLTLAAAENLANEGDVLVTVNVVDTNVKSFTGASVAAGVVAGAVTDGIAPAFAATTPVNVFDNDNNGQIDKVVIEYTENINKDTVSLLSYTVAGYTVSAVKVLDIAVGTPAQAAASAVGTQNGEYVVLTLTEKSTKDTGAVPAVTQALTIQDTSANGLVAQAAKTPVDKALAVTTVTAQTIKTSATATFQVSEPGTAYLVDNALAANAVDTVAELDALVTGGTATKATVTTANTATTIAGTTAEGTRALVVVDAAGNVSLKTVTLITIDNTVPTVVTGVTTKMLTATTFQVTFSEAVNAVAGDFTAYAYDADAAGAGAPVSIAIVSIAGSGTNTITVTTAANAGFNTGVGTATVNIAATVTDLAGNALAPVTAQAIATN